MNGLIYYIFNLVILLYFTGVLFVNAKIRKKLLKINYGITAFAALLIVVDAAGAIRSGGVRYMAFASLVLGCTACFYTLYEKENKNIKREFSDLFKIAAVCFLFEIIVFNFNSTHLFTHDYQPKQLSYTEAECSNFNISTFQTENQGSGYLEFKGLNIPVGTITVDASSNKKSTVKFNIDVKDDTHSAKYYGSLATAEVIKDNERSKTIICNFFGNTRDLKFNFNVDQDEKITINKITINSPVPLRFSVTRFLILFFAVFGMYLLKNNSAMQDTFKKSEKYVRICAYAITAVMVIFALFLTNAGRSNDKSHSLSKDFHSESGNQMTKELVDTFKNKTVVIDEDPAEELAKLDNPYDWSQRDNISYPWDHLYFDGKIYSYYGIAPIILLFLPYNLITGYYFPSSWAVWLFGVIGIIYLTKMYLLLCKKFFEDIKASLIVSGLLILQLTSGIYLCFNYANFYEIAQSAGFVFLPSGFYYMLRSNVIGNGDIKKRYLAISTALLSFGVLSRPTLALYCIAALFYIYAGFITKLKNIKAGKAQIKKTYAAYFAAAMLPFVCIGLVQMLYNYARFKSFFDFGIQYSLTINDFTQTEFHTQLTAIGFYNFLLLFPGASERFPFYNLPGVLQFMPQGYYFIATSPVVGLLWRALPLWSYCKAKKAYTVAEDKNKKLYTLLIFISCVVCPFIIIFSIWESGYASRYSVDCAWQMITGALIIAYILYRRSGSELKVFLDRLMRISVMAAVIFTVGDMYNWIINNVSTDLQASMYSFARLFEFWR